MFQFLRSWRKNEKKPWETDSSEEVGTDDDSDDRSDDDRFDDANVTSFAAPQDDDDENTEIDEDIERVEVNVSEVVGSSSESSCDKGATTEIGETDHEKDQTEQLQFLPISSSSSEDENETELEEPTDDEPKQYGDIDEIDDETLNLVRIRFRFERQCRRGQVSRRSSKLIVVDGKWYDRMLLKKKVLDRYGPDALKLHRKIQPSAFGSALKPISRRSGIVTESPPFSIEAIEKAQEYFKTEVERFGKSSKTRLKLIEIDGKYYQRMQLRRAVLDHLSKSTGWMKWVKETLKKWLPTKEEIWGAHNVLLDSDYDDDIRKQDQLVTVTTIGDVLETPPVTPASPVEDSDTHGRVADKSTKTTTKNRHKYRSDCDCLVCDPTLPIQTRSLKFWTPQRLAMQESVLNRRFRKDENKMKDHPGLVVWPEPKSGIFKGHVFFIKGIFDSISTLTLSQFIEKCGGHVTKNLSFEVDFVIFGREVHEDLKERVDLMYIRQMSEREFYLFINCFIFGLVQLHGNIVVDRMLPDFVPRKSWQNDRLPVDYRSISRIVNEKSIVLIGHLERWNEPKFIAMFKSLKANVRIIRPSSPLNPGKCPIDYVIIGKVNRHMPFEKSQITKADVIKEESNGVIEIIWEEDFYDWIENIIIADCHDKWKRFRDESRNFEKWFRRIIDANYDIKVQTKQQSLKRKLKNRLKNERKQQRKRTMKQRLNFKTPEFVGSNSGSTSSDSSSSDDEVEPFVPKNLITPIEPLTTKSVPEVEKELEECCKVYERFPDLLDEHTSICHRLKYRRDSEDISEEKRKSTKRGENSMEEYPLKRKMKQCEKYRRNKEQGRLPRTGDPKVIQCPDCLKTFEGPGHKVRFKNHRFVHLNMKPWSCRDCGKRFSSHNSIFNHRAKYCPTIESERRRKESIEKRKEQFLKEIEQERIAASST